METKADAGSRDEPEEGRKSLHLNYEFLLLNIEFPLKIPLLGIIYVPWLLLGLFFKFKDFQQLENPVPGDSEEALRSSLRKCSISSCTIGKVHLLDKEALLVSVHFEERQSEGEVKEFAGIVNMATFLCPVF